MLVLLGVPWIFSAFAVIDDEGSKNLEMVQGVFNVGGPYIQLPVDQRRRSCGSEGALASSRPLSPSKKYCGEGMFSSVPQIANDVRKYKNTQMHVQVHVNFKKNPGAFSGGYTSTQERAHLPYRPFFLSAPAFCASAPRSGPSVPPSLAPKINLD